MGLKAAAKKQTTKRRPAKKRGPKKKSAPPARAGSPPIVVVATRFHVNRIELGKLMGVHPDTVTDYARTGMPVLMRGGAGREGVYDAIACLDWWRQQQGKNAKETAQTRAYDATAALNELKLQEQQGDLVRREQVALEGQHYTAALRAKILALPRGFVHTGLIEQAQEQKIAEAMREALREIARWTTMADLKAAIEGAAA